jgi:two-component sensor histidine kinase
VPKLGSNVQKFPAGENLIAMSQYRLLAGAPSKESQNGGETVDLGSVLIELVEHCRQQMAPDLTISLSAKLGAGASIPTREAITLEFVICEIVTNAYRYSNPLGTSVEVTIECRVNRNGEIVIDIGDDGVGLPPDFAEWCDAGNGMVSVRHELQKIGAVLNITTDDLGLRFQIILHPCRPRKTPARGNFVWL